MGAIMKLKTPLKCHKNNIRLNNENNLTLVFKFKFSQARNSCPLLKRQASTLKAKCGYGTEP